MLAFGTSHAAPDLPVILSGCLITPDSDGHVTIPRAQSHFQLLRSVVTFPSSLETIEDPKRVRQSS